MIFRVLYVRAVILSALLAIGTGTAFAGTEEDFFKGKQIKIISASSPGDSYDAYSRVMAEYIGRHIPGNPAIVVQNVPGAGGTIAVNNVIGVGAKDGTVIGGVISSIPIAPLLSDVPLQFDVLKMNWLGSITKDTFVGYIWHASPIQSLADMKTKQAVMGGVASAGGASVEYPVMAKELFGFNIKLINGYNSTPDIKLATERGEIDGSFANSWTSIKLQSGDWLRDHKIRLFAQFGYQKLPELSDVPLFFDEAKTETQREILKLLFSRQEFSKAYFLPPGVPADRIAVWRKAFDDTMQDPDYLAAMKKANLDIVGTMHWQELTQLIAEINHTPPEVVAQAKEILGRSKTK